VSPLEVVRYTAFLIFIMGSGVAVAAWAVQSGRVNQFRPLGRALRGLTDPILRPVERWLVRSGGNPQNAGWWILGVALAGGIVVVSLAGWLAGQLALASVAATSGRGVLRLLVYYAGQLVMLAIIIRVIGSWVGVGRYHPWMRPAYFLTDWLIEPLRKIVPAFGMLDITPIIAWFAIQIVLRWLMTVL